MEVGVKESSKKTLVTSTWAGHVEKMGDEKLAKIVDGPEMEGKWRRGRPRNCIKSDLERVGEE